MRAFTTAVCVAVCCALVFVAGCGEGGGSGGASGGGGATADKPKKIRAGIGFNDKMPQYQALVVFKDALEEATGGRYAVELYHSSQLGDDRSMIEALQLGTQEITCPASAPLVGFVEEFQVLDLPYLFSDFETMHAVLSGDAGRGLLDKLDGVGLHGLAYLPEGFRCVTNNKRAIRTPADLKGLKVRTMENPLHLQAFRAWGANPTPMPFGEVFSALEQGVVDGQENPPAVPWNAKFFEVQKHFSDTNHFAAPYVLLVSGPFWEKLSDEDKAAFRTAAQTAYEAHKKIVAENAEQLMTDLSGVMEVTRLTAEERKAFFEASKPVYDAARKKVGDALVDEFISAAEAAQGG